MNKLHNIDHFSYSMAKNIYRKGIDYAVGLKLKLFEKTETDQSKLGKMIHAHLLGGEQNFVVKKYDSYRTKEAREWRDAQTLPIISEEEFDLICLIADRIRSHRLASKLLLGDGVESEIKMSAKINGLEWVGYADALKRSNKIVERIVDLKTTAQFDEFKWQAFRNDYDLQASTYKVFAQNDEAEFYWVIAETVKPYRIGVAKASAECFEKGYDKLSDAVRQIKEFKARKGETDLEKINFNQNETEDSVIIIGDWSN